VKDSQNKNNYLTKKQNQSIQSIQSIRIENEVKVNASFYMRKSIADISRSYAKRAGMSVGDFVEQSFIQFMDVNPIQEFFYAIEQPPKINNTVENTMLEIICIGDLEEWYEKIQPYIEQNRAIPKSRVKDVYDIIKRCRKINNISKRLEQLIQEAAKYVTESNL